MKASIKLLFCYVLAVFSFGCNDDDDGGAATPSEFFVFTFNQSAEGWEGGFADYPKDWEESRFEFEFDREDLPSGVGENSMAMKLSGRNISDDLFMFMKKQITGLEPNHTYRVTFQIELASQYPEESVGIGGSPGASVYLKAGGATIEPMPVEEQGAGNNIRMNIDKGGQSQGGKDMVVLGNVGIPGNAFEYRLINRDNLQNPIEITTDSNGSLWIIVGTDSGFEGTTTLYYNTIEVELEY
ncbi:hypothetical protein ABID22_001185 [Pontibacter aydingkolensis]|uniref:Lipoprotein n=1 Tax=Pontibacter aydingkolensis TaxID=1911536 RepID=A0ABS7CTD2_9BACT|nr:hypothetical protein [Pontibacter aydingkolensis]MBW7467093.1 hypothetical protein [Pontibacter aydingkolensis]